MITPHFVKPLSPEERAKLPDFPVTFLPSNADGKKAADFAGPRGHQDPQ